MRCEEVAVCAGPTLSDPTMLHATSAGPLASGQANIRGLDRGAGPGSGSRAPHSASARSPHPILVAMPIHYSPIEPTSLCGARNPNSPTELGMG